MTARYRHTQKGRFHWLVLAIGLVQILLGFSLSAPAVVRGLLAAAGGMLVFFAFAFARLTIRDTGDHLRIAYGPIPLFDKRVPYGEIRSFQPARSWILDGWGIHWLPVRGWTWNLHGRDCIEIETTRGRLRVGTDDPQGLADHLASRVG